MFPVLQKLSLQRLCLPLPETSKQLSRWMCKWSCHHQDTPSLLHLLKETQAQLLGMPRRKHHQQQLYKIALDVEKVLPSLFPAGLCPQQGTYISTVGPYMYIFLTILFFLKLSCCVPAVLEGPSPSETLFELLCFQPHSPGSNMMLLFVYIIFHVRRATLKNYICDLV